MPDAGTSDAGWQQAPDGGVWAIRFGATAGLDGLYSDAPVDPNLRTVAGWFRLRTSVVPRMEQQCAWSLENAAPSTTYQLMLTTFGLDQWESHDSSQGGFLFAPVDLGWWFVAETHDAAHGKTTLYWKKEGGALQQSEADNPHPPVSGLTRFLVGTDDATGQNEYFDGDAAGIKVWAAALSASELELESRQLSPVRTSGLHAFYPLQSVETLRDARRPGPAPPGDRARGPVEPAAGSYPSLLKRRVMADSAWGWDTRR